MKYRFENFYEGRKFITKWIRTTKEEILEFSHRYDPQIFHLGNDHREFALFDSVIASGWHSCALCQRLIVECYLQDSTCLTATGVDSIRYISPLYPDSQIRVISEVKRAKSYERMTDVGIVTFENLLENRDGTGILKMAVKVLFAK